MSNLEERLGALTNALLLSFSADSTERQKEAEAELARLGEEKDFTIILMTLAQTSLEKSNSTSSLTIFIKNHQATLCVFVFSHQNIKKCRNRGCSHHTSFEFH